MADLTKFFTALAGLSPAGPAALEQLHTALERLPLIVQHTKENAVVTISPRAHQILDELTAQVPAAVAARNWPTPFAAGGVLAPPLADPTRPRRRHDRPRLVVRAVTGFPMYVLPAADARNLTDRRAGLWSTEWETWFVDEHGQEQMIEFHNTGAAALANLPFVLRQVGLLNEDGTRPAPVGGASHAA